MSIVKTTDQVQIASNSKQQLVSAMGATGLAKEKALLNNPRIERLPRRFLILAVYIFLLFAGALALLVLSEKDKLLSGSSTLSVHQKVHLGTSLAAQVRRCKSANRSSCLFFSSPPSTLPSCAPLPYTSIIRHARLTSAGFFYHYHYYHYCHYCCCNFPLSLPLLFLFRSVHASSHLFCLL